MLLKGTVTKVVIGTASIQPGPASLLITTDVPASGDFSITALPEFHQNYWQSPSFRVFGSFGANPPGSAILLSVTGLPSGVTANVQYVFPATAILNCEPLLCGPLPGYTALVGFTIAGTVAAGSYPITITGTMGSVVHSVNVNLDVRPIPTPWLETDIQTSGRGEYSSGVFTLFAIGASNSTKRIEEIPSETMDALLRYGWPGTFANCRTSSSEQ